ncbi:hypothetical protein P280DRAFT_471293 [Massarina eburnea CBS 473.64]|uniref:FAD/NAD(P)-binding domain-containing protein n=1 Tax=Massarina eburnea CBS 473.64 TaxID=1395130 RepID=A0A6A6RT95_9PLEO|nr:hypothetical protein P280DRAFT_471293 [Massarina eburnea CBS 473.64]
MASSPTHEIVILGANFAGVYLTHYLLRQTIPILTRLDASQTYHVTLISPSTHFYFKIAGPRAMINETLIPTDKLFRSIPEAIAQYASQCAFIQGKAVGLEPEKRIVNIEEHSGESRNVRYDSLFICTGTTSASPLWTLHGDHEISVKAMKEMHALLPKAKTVLVAGAGAVGVEAVGEIAAAFPEIKITLIAGGDVLEKTKPATAMKMKKMLDAVGAEVITNVRVNDSSAKGDVTTVELSNGSTRTVDIFIDARGARKVNSEFLPKSWLDDSNRVKTLDSYFRVKGDDGNAPPNTYVLGDIVSGSLNTAIEVEAQISVVASSFAVDVTSVAGVKPASSGGVLSWIPGFGSKTVAQKEYKPIKDTLIVPFGPGGGVGQVMGWQIPNIMVKKAKAEKFFLEMVEPGVSGSKYSKA